MANTNLLIASFPRSGSHYLQHILIDSLDTRVIRRHPGFTGFDDNPIIPSITLIRNPLDTISSVISLVEKRSLSADPGYGWSIMLEPFTDEEISTKIVEAKNIYLATMNFAENKSDLIIKFETLVSDPESVIDLISNRFEIPVVSYEVDYEAFLQNNDDVETETTVNYPRYDYIKSIVENVDLSECNNRYLEVFAQSDI